LGSFWIPFGFFLFSFGRVWLHFGTPLFAFYYFSFSGCEKSLKILFYIAPGHLLDKLVYCTLSARTRKELITLFLFGLVADVWLEIWICMCSHAFNAGFDSCHFYENDHASKAVEITLPIGHNICTCVISFFVFAHSCFLSVLNGGSYIT
jgi:hypothetical protein